ncbi:MAG: hypothetical protein ACOC4B_01450 [Bacteroidota bacterium]
MSINKKLFLVFGLVYSFNGFSQTINSPYSQRDIGNLAREGYSQIRGIGGTSLAIRSSNYINYVNPASYTSQDTSTFLFDIGLIGKYKQLSSSKGNASDQFLNLNNIGLGIPVYKWWKFSLGMVPYSRVGYNIKDESDQQGFEVTDYYEGMGGINQFYFGNAFSFWNKVSIGLNVSYYFGEIDHVSEKHADTIKVERTKNTCVLNGLRFNGGIQYHDKINEDLGITIGVIYGNKTAMKSTCDSLVETTPSSLSDQNFIRDTIINKTNIKQDVDLPMKYGAGIAITYKDKWLIGLDYKQGNWGTLSNQGMYKTLGDMSSINFGVELIPERHSLKYYWKRMRYRIGAFYEKNRRIINGTQLENRGISVGLGFPLKYSSTTFNISYEFNKFGTTEKNLILMNNHTILFNISFHDIWFVKPKIR